MSEPKDALVKALVALHVARDAMPPGRAKDHLDRALDEARKAQEVLAR